jgi:hypothetical protein
LQFPFHLAVPRRTERCRAVRVAPGADADGTPAWSRTAGRGRLVEVVEVARRQEAEAGQAAYGAGRPGSRLLDVAAAEVCKRDVELVAAATTRPSSAP